MSGFVLTLFATITITAIIAATTTITTIVIVIITVDVVTTAVTALSVGRAARFLLLQNANLAPTEFCF